MALPDISFTNNLGTLSFKRAMLTIGDDWLWDGRNAVKRKRIQVDAMVAQGESLTSLLRGDNTAYGQRGTLTLPWTQLEKVRIESMDTPTNVWLDLVPVSVSFVDDLPANNLYTVTFFGIELHNPRLSMPIPVKTTTETYMQTPFFSRGSVAASNPWYGPIRYRTGYEMMNIALSGTAILANGILPTDIIQILQQRIGVGDVSGDLPQGYPRVFSLGEAIPEISRDLSIAEVFVQQAQVRWSVERKSAQITVQMNAQPQAWAEG